MTPTAPVLLCGLLFLCGLKEAHLSRLGRCAGDLCAFQAVVDFDGAVTECKKTNGEFPKFSSEERILGRFERLPGGFSGGFWLKRPDRKREEAAEGVQTCPAVFVTPGLNVTVLWKPCRDKLSGFLCEFQQLCSSLQTSGGAQITYTSYGGIVVTDSEVFPPGTTAAKTEVRGEPPASKHLCADKNWLPAPWNCEVMTGGCELGCNRETNICTCPEGHILHSNQISCTRRPCADCAQGCGQEGGSSTCECKAGFRLAQDGKGCVDVNECEEMDPCTAEGQECQNNPGSYKCVCKEDFELEDGKCVNISICSLCEQINCTKISGVYQCVCGQGYRVLASDPTKCELYCPERDCPAECEKDAEQESKDMQQCNCPEGYILDIRNRTATCTDINECENKEWCDHKCENLFGGYRCLCNEGFTLKDESRCVSMVEEDNYGSGSTESFPTPASRPASGYPDSAALPSYIKTGSILGISLFLLLCLVLLCFLIRQALRRCGTFHLSSLKRPDIDMFYLHQVTSETYKRLSFEKQFKNDSQRL